MKFFGLQLALFLLLVTGSATAEPINVGIKEAPPFALKDAQGNWTGISVELWHRVAENQDWQTRWVEMDSAKALVDGLTGNQIDVAVGALSMTPEREEVMDFSHPFYSTGLAIVTATNSGGWLSALGQLLSPAFLSAVGILVALLLLVGALLWLVEHKRNQQFGGSLAEGIGNGFWWSAVTMTTVGYGDKAPITRAGRLLATIWMFVSVITISSFTAAIASSITVNQLSTNVSGIDDLNRVRTLAITGSTGEQFLRKSGIRVIGVDSAANGLKKIRDGKADAMVHDAAILRYLLRDEGPDLVVLKQPIENQEYALGLRSGFEARETLNRLILSYSRGPEWQQTLNRYLGEQ